MLQIFKLKHLYAYSITAPNNPPCVMKNAIIRGNSLSNVIIIHVVKLKLKKQVLFI